jgi:hypothetical protein
MSRILELQGWIQSIKPTSTIDLWFASTIYCWIVLLFIGSGQVPKCFKHAHITPIVTKSDLDNADLCSYRPISNLSVLSKTLEHLVAAQLLSYLNKHQLLPSVQSGFRPGHSTETAVLKILSDILAAVDRGDIAVLVLRRTFGIVDQAHSWFRSYLSGRTKSVRRGDVTSSSAAIDCGVPQGSVLGPILFLLYTAYLQRTIQQHQLTPHLYADEWWHSNLRFMTRTPYRCGSIHAPSYWCSSIEVLCCATPTKVNPTVCLSSCFPDASYSYSHDWITGMLFCMDFRWYSYVDFSLFKMLLPDLFSV